MIDSEAYPNIMWCLEFDLPTGECPTRCEEHNYHDRDHQTEVRFALSHEQLTALMGNG